jgi:hypothetical protein
MQAAQEKTSAPTLPLVHATKCTFFLASTTRVQCGDLVQRNRVMGSWPETPVTLSVRANLVATFDQKRRGISSLQECLFGHFMLAQSPTLKLLKKSLIDTIQWKEISSVMQ